MNPLLIFINDREHAIRFDIIKNTLFGSTLSSTTIEGMSGRYSNTISLNREKCFEYEVYIESFVICITHYVTN